MCLSKHLRDAGLVAEQRWGGPPTGMVASGLLAGPIQQSFTHFMFTTPS